MTRICSRIVLLVCSHANILGDPGADREAKGKSKRSKENGHEEKHSSARRAPGDTFLPDQFQTVGVILNSDWCQKFFVSFCPIRGQEAVKSFRVFLHGNHLIAILAWFVQQGFARGLELSQSQHKMYRESFGISAEKYAGPFAGIITMAYFLPDSPKIAVINSDLTTIFILPFFLVEVFQDFLHQLLWLKRC